MRMYKKHSMYNFLLTLFINVGLHSRTCEGKNIRTKRNVAMIESLLRK